MKWCCRAPYFLVWLPYSRVWSLIWQVRRLCMVQSGNKPRLSRETWLAEALKVLAEDPTHLRVDQLAERLGVSKGSFYWHFENREAFVRALAEYWKDADTQSVVRAIAEVDGVFFPLNRRIIGNHTQ